MKNQKNFILIMVLILIASVYGNRHRVLTAVTRLTNHETSQIILPSETVKEATVNDEFQAFIEKWKLSGLLPECQTMTTENQDEFVKYFQQFDDLTRNYIILLLQLIAADTTVLGEGMNDPSYGIYLEFCQYCLYDMNQDEIPEFILKTGACEADYMYTVYMVDNDKLVNCGELSGSHASLYTNGSGKFVRYDGHMGVYNIDVSTLEGTTLKTIKIADGVLDYEKNEDYPSLDQYDYGDYNEIMSFNGIPTLFLAAAG
ncbi:hypothetical protein [Anaeromicropila populeti]|uniref:Uncharacterized protein n=1 Tax=Anaeromicropila populeti TaxID=37658 RepID=A0A1I6LKB3_9FIRM|nr:hypothetical protein [Anaeromicropila populeti]SFS03945.1 hypothetical protein SAMN05661086_03357 [Anaeromicropila populeti]